MPQFSPGFGQESALGGKQHLVFAPLPTEESSGKLRAPFLSLPDETGRVLLKMLLPV